MLRSFPLVGLTLLSLACSDAARVDEDDNGSGSDGGVHLTKDGGTRADGGSTESTVGNGCDYSYSGYNSSSSVHAMSTVQWHCTNTTRTVTSNGIPDHEVGTFPSAACPNTISTQGVSASMPLSPKETGVSNPGPGGIGYAFNGVKFDPATAGSCTNNGSSSSCSLIGNTGNWNIEALGQSSFNFGVDDSNAHVQPSGAYHYHGMPEAILAKLDKGMAPTLVGYALDGFPIYARYGYSSAMDAASAVKVIRGSYQLKITADANRPDTGTYPMGAFTQDYDYVAGSGDLDECNGRVGVTPEFPNGIYHYYITDTYPFIGRCLKGSYTSNGMPPGSDGGMPPMPDGGSGGTCGSCDAHEVCCPSDLPCAGQCVPNCNEGPSCPSGLHCDSSAGVCRP